VSGVGGASSSGSGDRVPQDPAEALAQVSVRPAHGIVGAWGALFVNPQG